MSFIAPSPPSPPHTLSRSSSAILSRHSSSASLRRHSSASSLHRQSFSLSSSNLAEDYGFPMESQQFATQVGSPSQTPAPQSQLSSTRSQCIHGLENLGLVTNDLPTPTEREGTPCSEAPTEPASREPSPMAFRNQDFSVPVSVPQMPVFNLGRSYTHQSFDEPWPPRLPTPPRPESPPMSPHSHALSMGLKEIDFAYVDFPEKTAHLKEMEERRAARLRELQKPRPLVNRQPVPLASLYPERYGRRLNPSPSQEPAQESQTMSSTPGPSSIRPAPLTRTPRQPSESGPRGPGAAGPSSLSRLSRQPSLIIDPPVRAPPRPRSDSGKRKREDSQVLEQETGSEASAHAESSTTHPDPAVPAQAPTSPESSRPKKKRKMSDDS